MLNGSLIMSTEAIGDVCMRRLPGTQKLGKG